MPKIWQRDPSILLLPNVPKPMHGVNPRSVLGNRWWDAERNAAYRSTNYHCEACGVHKSQARFRKVVEGHEVYATDYQNGILKYVRTTPLCSVCHEYIHDGRLQALLQKGQITRGHYVSVMQHGDRLLAEVGLKKPSHSERDAVIMRDIQEGRVASWGNWRLVVDTTKYRTQVFNQRTDKVNKRKMKYIGRGSPWGNPFIIGKDGTRDEVCDQYERQVLPELNLAPLLGWDLLCFCHPQRCHGHSIQDKLYGILRFQPRYKSYEHWCLAHDVR